MHCWTSGKLSVIIAVSSAIDNLVMDYGSLAGEVFPDEWDHLSDM